MGVKIYKHNQETYEFLKNPGNRLLIDINSLKKKYKNIFRDLDKLKEVDFFKTAKIVHTHIPDPFASRAQINFDEYYEYIESLSLFSDYICAMYTWKKWKKIYNFNDTLIAELNDQADKTNPENLRIPMEFLSHIPFNSFFINANNFIDDIIKNNIYTLKLKKPFGDNQIIYYTNTNIDGILIRLEKDEKNRNMLTFLIPIDISYTIKNNINNVNSYEIENKYAMNYDITLDGDTIGDCIRISIDDRPFLDTKKEKDRYTKIVMRCLTYLLYILSANSDIEDGSKDTYKPKKKKESIIDSISEIQQFNVGYRVGAILKQHHLQSKCDASINIKDKKKVPHIRRGHWHHYWTGPRNSDHRELIVHWIPPIAINSNWKKENTIVDITPV